jgi:hypothetical protein
MIVTLLIWLYTLSLCYVYGQLFLKRLPIRADLPAAPLIVLVGLIVLTTLASFFSLFSEIGFWFNVLVLAGAIAAIVTNNVRAPRIQRPAAWIPLIVLGVALLLLLENATHAPVNPDTNIYHAQAIHWIENFPAVPGLGNLHGRLAFNSAWFISNAIFSLSFLGPGLSFHLTSSVLFLAVMFYFWGGFGQLARREYTTAALLKVLFFPIAFSLLGAELSSPGTDLPVSLLLWLMAVLWAESDQPFQSILIVLLATFVVTIKLSAAPILLFLPIAIFATENTEKFSFKISVFSVAIFSCAAFVLTPFLIRNVILSGYLLYPVPATGLFSFDWKVPLERAVGEQMAVLAWGRFPRLDAARVLAMPLSEWLPKWFNAQTPNRRLIVDAALLSPLLALPGLRLTRRFWLGWLIFFIGTLFWLFSAPDFRFGQGFLVGTILLALTPWLAALLGRTRFSPVKVSATASLLMAAYLMLALTTSFESRTLLSQLLLPAPYDHVRTQSCDLANGKVFCAKAYDECSYDAFPCIPSPRPWVELRKPGDLKDGFKSK